MNRNKPAPGWALRQLQDTHLVTDSARDRKISATIGAVSDAFNVERPTLTAANIRTKDATIVVARNIAAYLLREDCELSFKDIATRMGWKNHTSAVDAHARIAERIQADSSGKLTEVCETIRKLVTEDLKMVVDLPRQIGGMNRL